MTHKLIEINDDFETTCLVCRSIWSTGRPLGSCPGPGAGCRDQEDGRIRPHYYWDDGHCINCGAVDR